MWPDNETDVDLLGFDYLVDELEVLLTNERLLPLTVLVSGDWGSGKSSLMEVAASRLQAEENEERFICVKFTPWRFEDIYYGKVALMAAVVDAIADYAKDHEGTLEIAAKNANTLRHTLHRWGIWKHAATVGALAAGGGPEVAAAAGSAADAAAGAGDDENEPQRAFETIAHFHHEFEELIESLGDKVQAVVVFIDDMDRCSSTETIVETFEAMRLFLQAPKTAYVVGAHEEIVEAALDTRYAGRREGDEDLGGHWLEKMLQHTIAVPPLGEPEVLSYINLLFAEVHTRDEQFKALRAKSEENRARNPFQVAMNEGIARDVIGNLDDDLVEAFKIGEQVGPVVARSLRGNPRETKRFLNKLLVRVETAEKRKLALEPGKLAKLLVLEELLDQKHVEQVFGWVLAADDGIPQELAQAEQLAGGKRQKDVLPSVDEWVSQPKVKIWLQLEPSLAGTNLAPYFTFSRARLAGLITAPRLSSEQQALLADLQNENVDPKRAKAVTDTLSLDDDERAELLEALLDAVRQNPNGAAAKSLRELAAERPDIATAMFDVLDKLPVSKVKGNTVLSLGAEFKTHPRTKPLLEKWNGKGKADFNRQVDRALQKL